MSKTGTWFKSSFSKEAANCVEVRFAGDHVFIRDSKYQRDPANDPAVQPSITVRVGDWSAFLRCASMAANEQPPTLPTISRDAFGVTVSSTRTSLRFTVNEWESFLDGIQAGEFAAA
ncbi:DUF397 domain-containing protein [Nocardia sp. NPDC052566]|uniref:DUF397 domain-containing protein n=1 Tax=Nocardia sp. NPDC052566 TaxID=3364330 RepID=UPI0037C6FC51